MKINSKLVLVIYYVLGTALFADMLDKWVNAGIYNLLAGLIIAFVLHSLWHLSFGVNKK